MPVFVVSVKEGSRYRVTDCIQDDVSVGAPSAQHTCEPVPSQPHARPNTGLLGYTSKPTQPELDVSELTGQTGKSQKRPIARGSRNNEYHVVSRPRPSSQPAGRLSTRPSARPGARGQQSGENFTTLRMVASDLHGEQATERRHVLVRFDGPEAGRLFSLDAGAVLIGRSLEAGIHLPAAGVSREHARLESVKGEHFIEDLGSRNGTFVDRQRIQRQRLRDGALIQIGPESSFRFSVMNSAQQEVLQRLYESSTRDGLTGAHTRRYFDDVAESELAYAIRHDLDLSLVLMDIDFFKRVNDEYGHQGGDVVLKEVVSVASSGLRREDVFARFGGEEFGILLRNTPLKQARFVAERIRRAVGRMDFDLGGIPLNVTVSLGCATVRECRHREIHELIRLTDARLYEAKNTGRNRVVGGA